MKNSILLFFILTLLISSFSCKKDNNNCNTAYPHLLNDTLTYETANTPTIYNLDLDLNGTVDAVIESVLYTSSGGASCNIKSKVLDDNWSIITRNKLEYTCQDTISYDELNTWEYYKDYDCENSQNAYSIDTLIVPTLYQEDEIINIEYYTTEKEAVLNSYYGNIPGIEPGAVWSDITKGIFKNGVTKGAIIYVKNNVELYDLKIEIDTSSNPFNDLYIHEINRIGCE